MNLSTAIKTLILTATMIICGQQNAAAQDLLARQAPVDRKMKAVDTLVLKRLIEREQVSMPGSDLYDEWDNTYAHRETELPDSFLINLRGFCMPTPSRVVTSNYGARWGRQHKGIDVKVYIGDTIRAAFSGKVRVVKYDRGGYGNYIVIRHNNGLETIYGHLSKHLCQENQVVKAGDVIGLGGNTGRSTGSHLHFETRICGLALDPSLLFDFRNQDVTNDYYMFRKADYGRRTRNASKAVAKAQRSEELSANDEAKPVAPVNAIEEEESAAVPAKDNKKDKKQKKERYHKVGKGDSLYSIAQRYGMSVDELCRLNGIKKTKAIIPGQKLRCA